jgi:hypothetical protein
MKFSAVFEFYIARTIQDTVPKAVFDGGGVINLI